ncbi:hypothetical protein MRB53_021102 [Persea americana]|uniref:Uncharacterized protein n=1 Tax=Persea americana TaxID=3435 RepID=A0ACC2L2Z8_PERAE|nr:hypothetical protein MRB53_021102 [Persea americana]
MMDPVICNMLPSHPSLTVPDNKVPAEDPIFPYLCSIKIALQDLLQNPKSAPHLNDLLDNCIRSFENEDRYRNDIRFLKVWILHADATQDFERVFRVLEEKKICLRHSLLYESYAAFLEAKGKLVEAHEVYQLGISRNAVPLEHLKKLHSFFLGRMQRIVKACSLDKQVDADKSLVHGKLILSPWSSSNIDELLKKIDTYGLKCKGYHKSAKAYSGKVPLSSLKKSSRNKLIELGGIKYLIKGCSGQGGFAQVFKAFVDSNPDEIVALKIQKPAFPWEFYMYRQLDKRVSDDKRPSFGFAHRVHIYADCSILVCDYEAHGTLQDVINSYLVIGQWMDEVLCIYYSIEMLRMLETLHNVGIIHGDFKPDNLLVRYARDELTEDGFSKRTRPWRDQGLCLIDWGRGIDLSLFPDGVQFKGDSRTSGFRCVEMQENRPWTYQVDIYGLCVTVHLMLHGSYLSIKKKESPDGHCLYQPDSSLKRYWNIDLWSTFFTKLLNLTNDDDSTKVLESVRKSLEDYLCSSPQLIKKLKMLLVKQRDSLCSA